MDLQTQIDAFLAGAPHAVVGASPKRHKYGNKVLRAYMQTERPVYAIHPIVETVEGLPTYQQLADLPEAVYGLSVITPPVVTERIVTEAVALGIRHIWMQPGAESEAAIAAASAGGMDVIAGGPCLLVALRFREDPTA